METKQKSARKMREGVVVSNKMQKTVTVLVSRTYQHPKFDKVVTRGKKYYAHVEKNDIQVGQRVRIVETRPLSRLKRWQVLSVIA